MRRQAPTVYFNPEKIVTLEIETPVAKVAPPTAPIGRVLLLEDREDFREILRDHLASRFYEVISVPSGVEGLREISKCAFDVIICDMIMPQVGGETFYWAVTRLRPAAGRRFIFLRATGTIRPSSFSSNGSARRY